MVRSGVNFVMSELIATPPAVPAQPSLAQASRWRKAVLPITILLGLVALGLAYYGLVMRPANLAANQAASQVAPTLISTQALEERYGIRIRMVAVTALGGILDLRYKVIDKDKAAFLLSHDSAPPKLIDETSGKVFTTPSHGMKHNSNLENGNTYFHFIANAGNVIKPGALLSVQLGTVRVGPIVAQ
jgi:hypothetical protein